MCVSETLFLKLSKPQIKNVIKRFLSPKLAFKPKQLKIIPLIRTITKTKAQPALPIADQPELLNQPATAPNRPGTRKGPSSPSPSSPLAQAPLAALVAKFRWKKRSRASSARGEAVRAISRGAKIQAPLPSNRRQSFKFIGS